MSSFLVNSSIPGTIPTDSGYHHHHLTHHHLSNTPPNVLVDPKFPPTEEYSQNNYISSGDFKLTNPDYFQSQHLQQQHLQYGYHHQATTTPYGAPGPNYSTYPSNYYHHPHQIHHTNLPHIPSRQHIIPGMHDDQPQLPCAAQGGLQGGLPNLPPVTSTTSLSDTDPSNVVSAVSCSPVSSHQDHMHHSPQTGAQAQPHLHELGMRLERLEENGDSEVGDDLDDDQLMMDGSPLMDDDMDDDESESGDRVIYPWMKKIHVAGVSK